jgi:hypothetical protein
VGKGSRMDDKSKSKFDELRKNLPPGWRQEDFEIWEKLSLLEAKVEISRNREHAILESIKRISSHITTLAEDQRYIIRELSKLTEVYYHVFPDRLSQDVKFEKQIDALTSKSGDGANLKKP